MAEKAKMVAQDECMHAMLTKACCQTKEFPKMTNWVETCATGDQFFVTALIGDDFEADHILSLAQFKTSKRD